MIQAQGDGYALEPGKTYAVETPLGFEIDQASLHRFCEHVYCKDGVRLIFLPPGCKIARANEKEVDGHLELFLKQRIAVCLKSLGVVYAASELNQYRWDNVADLAEDLAKLLSPGNRGRET